MKIAFICTALNEEDSILNLLTTLDGQTQKPDEVILVDGGSSDGTVAKVKSFQTNSKLKIKLLIKKGNRSVGRNTAIENSTSDIIACSDAGCELDKNWLKNITSPFGDENVDVVAGYYRGRAQNIFQKCLIPYALVMPDKVGAEKFLPATRSTAFKKSVWKKLGGFNEKLSHNEDYAFARKIKKSGYKIVFQKSAIANWFPPDSFKSAFQMFYRFAKGDIESGILRPKVLLIFARYTIGLVVLYLAIINKSMSLFIATGILLLSYAIWSILKNYKYVKNSRAFVYLPLIQLESDVAVLLGSLKGIVR